MTGRDIALATLMREDVGQPCINYCWMTNASYMSRVAGTDYWSDREGVFYAYLARCGINLVPQDYIPGEAQRNISEGHLAHEHLPGGTECIATPEEIIQRIEELPSDEQVVAEYDVEGAADDYARSIIERTARAGGEVLFIDSFGQADFMGGYTRWGYANYLMAMIDDLEAMRRYFHHSALCGRLRNMAIVLACDRYGIAPFVYGGQDICTAKGPIVSPALLRAIYFPELRWCVEPLLDAEIGIIWHCDGNINPILPDILGLGVMGLQGFEEEHGVRFEEMAALRDRRGRPISLWGCVSVTSTLPFGTPEDVRRAVERSFLVAGRGRGFVLSSTSSVMPEVPHENIDALFQHAHAYGEAFLGG